MTTWWSLQIIVISVSKLKRQKVRRRQRLWSAMDVTITWRITNVLARENFRRMSGSVGRVSLKHVSRQK